MIRIALGKGRNLPTAVAALAAAGLPLADLAELERAERRLSVRLPSAGLEVLLLKDADLPLYVSYGVADLGVIGSDVLSESESDLLVPLRFPGQGARLSFIGRPGTPLEPGRQLRLATKYPRSARAAVEQRPWSAEILVLAGSVELAPLLDLADLAFDVVQTGRTLRDNGLVELEQVAPVEPCLAINRASFLRHRPAIHDLIERLAVVGAAGVAA